MVSACTVSSSRALIFSNHRGFMFSFNKKGCSCSVLAVGQQERQPRRPRGGAMGSALQHCLWGRKEDVQAWLTSTTQTIPHPLAQTPCSPSKLLIVIWLPIETLPLRRGQADQLTVVNIPESAQLSVS